MKLRNPSCCVNVRIRSEIPGLVLPKNHTVKQSHIFVTFLRWSLQMKYRGFILNSELHCIRRAGRRGTLYSLEEPVRVFQKSYTRYHAKSFLIVLSLKKHPNKKTKTVEQIESEKTKTVQIELKKKSLPSSSPQLIRPTLHDPGNTLGIEAKDICKTYMEACWTDKFVAKITAEVRETCSMTFLSSYGLPFTISFLRNFTKYYAGSEIVPNETKRNRSGKSRGQCGDGGKDGPCSRWLRYFNEKCSNEQVVMIFREIARALKTNSFVEFEYAVPFTAATMRRAFHDILISRLQTSPH